MFHGDKKGQRRAAEKEKKAQDRVDDGRQEQRDARARLDNAQKHMEKESKAVEVNKEKQALKDDYRQNKTQSWPDKPIPLSNEQESFYHDMEGPLKRLLQFLDD